MRVRVKLGAKADGTLTAIALDVVSNTGAYGNHAGGVLHHGTNEVIGVYRCPNKRVDGYAVYTNTLPAGAFRGYGLSQTIFAVESAMDELARDLGLDPYAMRRRNAVRPGDPMVSTSLEPHDVAYGSYGLDQCLDLAERAMAAPGGDPAPEGWRVGEGMAMAMIDTIPPRGHFAEARIRLCGTQRAKSRGFPAPLRGSGLASARVGRGERHLRAARSPLLTLYGEGPANAASSRMPRILRPLGRHRRVRQRHHHGACPDRGRGARHRAGPHPDPRLRHRRGRPRYRRLRQHRHRRGGARHAERRGGAGAHDPDPGRGPVGRRARRRAGSRPTT